MEYRAKAQFESLTWLLLNGLVWVGVIGIAWNLLKPGGWLYWIIDLVVGNQPVSFYYIAVGVLGLLAGKIWLDNIDPRAFYNLLTASWAFAGTFFILSLLLPL
jgi:hypothetical protein